MLNPLPAPADSDDQAGRALERARAGDTDAFATIIRQHQAMVFSLSRHFLRDRAAAEDLAQDVFLQLYENLSRLESAAHVKFWLRRVTANRCIDRLRRPGETPFPEVGQREVGATTTGRDVLLEERLRACVGRLPARPRMVVILRYQEDLDPGEIAETLNMPLNTVKSHLRRSLAVLRRYLMEVTTP
jgi:RNA polymerase sigma-70 factor (ECF subfamily)